MNTDSQRTFYPLKGERKRRVMPGRSRAIRVPRVRRNKANPTIRNAWLDPNGIVA